MPLRHGLVECRIETTLGTEGGMTFAQAHKANAWDGCERGKFSQSSICWITPVYFCGFFKDFCLVRRGVLRRDFSHGLYNGSLSFG